MKPLVCVDAYAQIFRSFYAVRSLTNSKGEPSNAVFAMTRFLMKADSEFKDCDGAFFFDSGRPPHRLALAPAYKANRPPMPDALKSQIPVIKELISAFGWPEIIFENWEADDLIGCAVKMFPERKRVIVSADKDLAQLIGENVEMLIPDQAGKGFARRAEAETLEKFGVPPRAIVDYLALTGDSADNIPGIEGVGPKTAAELINSCGSIENMLAHPETIAREKLRSKIVAGAELLRKNIKLVELVTTPPENSAWNVSTFVRRQADYNAILATAETMELKSLVKEITMRNSVSTSSASTSAAAVCAAAEKNAEKKPDMEQMELF